MTRRASAPPTEALRCGATLTKGAGLRDFRQLTDAKNLLEDHRGHRTGGILRTPNLIFKPILEDRPRNTEGRVSRSSPLLERRVHVASVYSWLLGLLILVQLTLTFLMTCQAMMTMNGRNQQKGKKKKTCKDPEWSGDAPMALSISGSGR